MSEKKRILIADDVEAVTTLLVTALEVNGYEVVVATNGEDAFKLGKEEKFDLAIIDQLMPGLLGGEILSKWKEENINLPVIILSGVEDDDVVVSTLEGGAIDFVRKPFRLPELLTRIKRQVN